MVCVCEVEGGIWPVRKEWPAAEAEASAGEGSWMYLIACQGTEEVARGAERGGGGGRSWEGAESPA